MCYSLANPYSFSHPSHGQEKAVLQEYSLPKVKRGDPAYSDSVCRDKQNDVKLGTFQPYSIFWSCQFSS